MNPQNRDDLDTENGKKIKEALERYRNSEIDSQELIKEVREAEEEDVQTARNKIWWNRLKDK